MERASPFEKTIGLALALGAAWLGSRFLAAAPPEAERVRVQGLAPAPASASGVGAAAAPAAAGRKAARYEVVAVEGGGTVRASLRLTKPPEGPEVRLNKDVKGCGHEVMSSGRAVYDPATLGLANGVVWLIDVTKGKAFEGELEAADREVVLDQKGCAYVPHVMLVRAGARVAIRNSDPVQHNAKAFLGSKAQLVFNAMSSSNTTLPPVEDTTLTKPGLYLLNCDIHLWMTGYLRAVPHPYFALTGPDGTATLTNVPPGTYRVGCWHEGMALKIETTGAEISGYRYSDDFELPAQSVTVPAAGTVDVAFTTDPR